MEQHTWDGWVGGGNSDRTHAQFGTGQQSARLLTAAATADVSPQQQQQQQQQPQPPTEARLVAPAPSSPSLENTNQIEIVVETAAKRPRLAALARQVDGPQRRADVSLL